MEMGSAAVPPLAPVPLAALVAALRTFFARLAAALDARSSASFLSEASSAFRSSAL
jgi:hypothetical protein